MSYIRNTNPGFSHYERHRFGGLGGVTASEQKKKELTGTANFLWRDSGIGMFTNSEPTWRPATAYLDLLALRTRLKSYDRWDCGMFQSCHSWLKIDDMITKMLARIPTSAKLSVGTVASRQVSKAVSTERIDQQAAAKAPPPEPEKGMWGTAQDYIGDMFAENIWGTTGADEEGEYKEEELDREQAKMDASLKVRQEEAKKKPTAEPTIKPAEKDGWDWSWWGDDEPAKKPTAEPTIEPAKKEPGFWESLTGGLTGGFKSTSSAFTPGSSSGMPLDLMAMAMTGKSKPQQTIVVSQPKSGGNTGLYIGLGAGALVLVILGAVLLTRKKAPKL